MTILLWNTPLRIRVFQVTFRPDLDGGEKDDIRFGVFGDLRMGERYAVGLVARKKATAAEVRRVGRLARRLVEAPFEALKGLHNDIWAHDDIEGAFNEAVAQHHSSLFFSSLAEIRPTQAPPVVATNIAAVRTWCKGKLREELWRALDSWIGDPVLRDRAGTEDFEEAA